MESLLILILSVVVSGILSAKKKKKTAGYPHSEGKTSLPSSPWDDLIRDLQKDSDGGPYETAPGAANEEPAGDGMFSAGADGAPFEETVTDDLKDGAEPSPYFSYDDEVLAELSARQEPEPFAPERSTERSAETGKSTPASASELSSPIGTLFPDGFDPRMAVLYAEIMTPKFRQY